MLLLKIQLEAIPFVNFYCTDRNESVDDLLKRKIV